MNEEQRRKIRESMTGKPKSLEHRRKISKGMRGLKHDEEWVRKSMAGIERLRQGDAYLREQFSHKIAKRRAQVKLETMGWVVDNEKKIGDRVVDIWAEKNGRVVAVEVGRCSWEKIEELEASGIEVFRVPKLFEKRALSNCLNASTAAIA